MITITRRVSTPSTWDEIKEMKEAKPITDFLTVGDEISETLTTGEEVVFVVAGINLYAKKQILLSWKDCLAERHCMNTEWTNKGGWLESEMREYINDKVFNTLPEDLREIIIPRTLHSGKKSGEDKLWLPSEYEIFGGGSYKVSSDNDKHIPYYQNPANRRKSLGKGESACGWWERSPNYNNATAFCNVSSSGNALNSASAACGVAPCFFI